MPDNQLNEDSSQHSDKILRNNLIAALIYLLVARASLLLALPGSNATPVWPPSGIALAFFL
ncbi:MAG: hypothetical protein IPG53_14555 [Ignavibacteriales bacterium]|jgi:integral membrane sensor domain MASE1|nr:hypothetical protein [Ignavibacteriales bacterium]